MPRDGKRMRQMLRQAALALYAEQGFDGTTTAEIAERAGVTERTFFRHFGDKREVMFDELALRNILLAGVAEAPPSLPPMDVLLRAFAAAEPLLEENRSGADARQAIISVTPALQERQTTKLAALTTLLAKALQDRGVGDDLAQIAAKTGMIVFERAEALWRQDPEKALSSHLADTLTQLRSL